MSSLSAAAFPSSTAPARVFGFHASMVRNPPVPPLWKISVSPRKNTRCQLSPSDSAAFDRKRCSWLAAIARPSGVSGGFRFAARNRIMSAMLERSAPAPASVGRSHSDVTSPSAV